MPSAGLSLVGFMDEPQATTHLSTACILGNPSPAGIKAEWDAARARRGPPIAGAGHPNILDIPPADQPYITALCQEPWIAQWLPNIPGAEFKLVEIDPLLAFQFSVDTTRSDHHCAALPKPPGVADLFPICLPLHRPSGEYHVNQLPQSVIIKSRSLNLTMMAAGIGPDIAGINFGWAVPLLHVVRFNGRCYLHNGFHRAFGARLAGATHIPCIFRDVADAESAGIKSDGSTFGLPLLESNDPPTLGHFTKGLAHSATLRALTRILHVSWSSYAMYDE
jgi:hypothetical protein